MVLPVVILLGALIDDPLRASETPTTPMFERYSDGARQAIVSALTVAQRLGADSIDTDHLFVGAIATRSIDIQAIARLHGLDLESAVQEIKGNGDQARPPAIVDVPLTSVAIRILEHAEEEARLLDDRLIGPEHLFLAIIRGGGGIAGTVLKAHGVTIESAREELRTRRTQTGQ